MSGKINCEKDIRGKTDYEEDMSLCRSDYEKDLYSNYEKDTCKWEQPWKGLITLCKRNYEKDMYGRNNRRKDT